MRIAKLNQVDIHWRMDGNPDGRPVVFANSLGTDLRLWDKVIERLPQDLCFIRYDKRGHGLSSCPVAPYRMDELIEDAEYLLDHIGVQDAAFVGLSIGGMIAQGLATKRPDLIRTLVLSNTAASMGSPEMWDQRISMIKQGQFPDMVEPVLERWFSKAFLATDEAEAWRNMLARSVQEGYQGCCAAIAGADLTDNLARIQQPTLGICGSEDGASPPELVEATIKRIDGAHYHLIEGAGHLPCVEKPDVFSGLLTEFLKETDHVQTF